MPSQGTVRRRRLALVLLACAALAVGVVVGAGGGDGNGGDSNARRPPPEPPFSRLNGAISTSQAGLFAESGLDGWRESVPRIREVSIRSTKDGAAQRALWLPPAAGGPRPLIVVLHSWSTSYENVAGIPYARWAQQRGWGVIQPDYRGPFDDPKATGSDLAVQDVIDAVDFAQRDPNVDPDRVFGVGFSGGGMMALLLAGRHPDRFAGLASWVPIDDLAAWYRYTVNADPRYAEEIEASCGGDPTASATAFADCARRSPRTYLSAARRAKVPIYVGHGLEDPVVPPDQALRAFNRLAAPREAIAPDAVRAAAGNELPARLNGSVRATTLFRDGDPKVVFARRSGPVTLVLFEGEHDMVYNPTLEWMTGLARR